MKIKVACNKKKSEFDNTSILRCECGKRAEVILSTEYAPIPFCASCYVKKTLPSIDVELTDGETDFNDLTVGYGYGISSFKYPEFEPYEYGFKGCSELKAVADRVMCVGADEENGKKRLKFRIELKPEFQNLPSSPRFNRSFLLADLRNFKNSWRCSGALLKKILEEAKEASND